jgi:hypothetical protein
MMNPCFNSEEQNDPKLNEYRQVADRVREAVIAKKSASSEVASRTIMTMAMTFSPPQL